MWISINILTLVHFDACTYSSVKMLANWSSLLTTSCLVGRHCNAIRDVRIPARTWPRRNANHDHCTSRSVRLRFYISAASTFVLCGAIRRRRYDSADNSDLRASQLNVDVSLDGGNNRRRFTVHLSPLIDTIARLYDALNSATPAVDI